MQPATVLALQIDVDEAEVHRYLGYRHGTRRSHKVMSRLDEIWPQAVALLAPRGTFRVVEMERAAAAGMPKPAERVGVGLCTIGPLLEDEIAACTDRGALLDALLLDAIGSAAAEAAADALNQSMCAAARSKGLHAAPRVSPGYGAWDVAFQSALLALLPAAELGVTLTTGQMMVPRKSVSFAVSFESEARTGDEPSLCARCGMEHCRHRNAAAHDAGTAPGVIR